MSVLFEVALNGSRSTEEHPSVPRTPAELANAARRSVRAGAEILHLHVFDEDGNETFAPGSTSKALRAVREACPGVPISLTTSEGIEQDPTRRLQLVSQWNDLPDLVTANMSEAGIDELCRHLMARGVGIEAGILGLSDADAFARSELAGECARVLIEPLDADPDDAVEHATLMEERVITAGILLPQIHHGDGVASWSVNLRGYQRGHGIRTGLEDTTVLPDGTMAADNAQLVRAAVELVRDSDSITQCRPSGV